MAVQILGLRTYTRTDGTLAKAERFFDENWRAESVSDLLLKIEEHLEQIPEEERYNLYYTAADCFEEAGRKLSKQWIIPFDIDGIDLSRIQDYIDVVLHALNLDFEKTGIVLSGNGLQLLVRVHDPIEDESFFKENRRYYKILCDRVTSALRKLDLPGSADPSVFSPARLLRLPMTENRKTPEEGYPNKYSIKQATLHQRMLTPVEYDLKSEAGIKGDTEIISEEYQAMYAEPDTETILKQCDFLKHCKENPDEITEENWYKMLSILCRLDKDYTLCHQYSENYTGYNFDETQSKAEQAFKNSPPRLCENICETFEGCLACPHWQRVRSPIGLYGDGFIRTKMNGFRKLVYKDGKIGRGAVDVDDLCKFFEQQKNIISTENEMFYEWTGTHWSYVHDIHIEKFCYDHVDPKPRSKDWQEFRKTLVRRRIVQDANFFRDTIFRKMNLKNGVLDLGGDNPILLPHSEEFGFTSVLPYEYNPKEECPTFDMFMKDVTMNRKELEDILLEYAGFAFANESCSKYSKSLILNGEGRNGKSTFMRVLKKLAGADFFSSIPLSKLDNEQFTAQLAGVLFNLTEETPRKAFYDSSTFKNLVSGGEITVKVVYKQPYLIANNAKMIIACNEMPESMDMTEGMTRRLLIVPFDAKFDEGVNDDKDIDEKMYKELSGVLNRIIKGYYRLKNQNAFTSSVDVDKELMKYKGENDPVLAFVSEEIIIHDPDNEDFFIKNASLYEEFVKYCDRNGYYNKRNSAQLSKELSKKIPSMEQRRRKLGKDCTRIILGISFRADQRGDF